MKKIYSQTIRLAAAALMAGAMLFVPLSVTATQPANANIESIEAQQPVITLSGRRVEVSVPGNNDVTISVYALTGQLVKQVTTGPGQITVELPSGCYIVRVADVAKRVVIK